MTIKVLITGEINFDYLNVSMIEDSGDTLSFTWEKRGVVFYKRNIVGYVRSYND